MGGVQPDWRFCAKCFAMFFHGGEVNGVCPAGGAHVPFGFNFDLPHDFPETVTAQRKWRFCQKCSVMYFDGFPGFGVCAKGGGHNPNGFIFALPHDVPETPGTQKNWRFCSRCFTMFFGGVSPEHLLAGYGIRQNQIGASTDILTMRPGLAAEPDMQLTSCSSPLGSGYTCRAAAISDPVIRTFGSLPSGTSAPNTVLTMHAVHSLHEGIGALLYAPAQFNIRMTSYPGQHSRDSNTSSNKQQSITL